MSVPGNKPTKMPTRQGRSQHTPKATDFGIGMRPWTGRAFVVSGTKADGTAVVGRTLANCSFVPGAHGQHRVVGLDVSVGQVRTFVLSRVSSIGLRVGGPRFTGADVIATMDAGLADADEIVETAVEPVADDADVAVAS